MKINANFKLFAATNFDSSKYIASPSYGVNRFMLDRIGSEKARATSIVEYKPNSKFPQHTHIGGEEFLVLEGTFKDQYGEFPAGTYVRNPIGSVHEPWVDDDGCTIMVKLLQMAETGEGVQPLHVKYDKAEKQETAYGSVVDMYQNEETGEHVEMCWIKPDNYFPPNDIATQGGEELFVLGGSVSFCDKRFTRWGWLRFPSGTGADRLMLKAGSGGAQVYRKMGHLTAKALSMEKIQITEDGEVLK